MAAARSIGEYFVMEAVEEGVIPLELCVIPLGREASCG
jgi:hypothetical protein